MSGYLPGVLANGVVLTGPSADGTSGQVLQTDGSGALSFGSVDTSSLVTGPASATDNAIPRYDGTTGKLIQGSGVVVDDSNNVTIPGSVDVDSFSMSTASASLTLSQSSNENIVDIGTAQVLKVRQNGTNRIVLRYDGVVYFNDGVQLFNTNGDAQFAGDLEINETLSAPDASGSNTAATNLVLQPGQSAGNAAPAVGKLQASASAGSSGSTLQTSVDHLTWGNGRVTLSFPMVMPELADASAPNSSVYFSTDASALVYKDSGGTVHALY